MFSVIRCSDGKEISRWNNKQLAYLDKEQLEAEGEELYNVIEIEETTE